MRSRTHSFTRGLRRPRSRKYAGPYVYLYLFHDIYIYIRAERAILENYLLLLRAALYIVHTGRFLFRAQISDPLAKFPARLCQIE